ELDDLTLRVGQDEAERTMLERLDDGSLLTVPARRFAPPRSDVEPGAQRRGAWLADARDDFLFAIRAFRKSPAFTTVAVLTLALGIGATTAMYSEVDAVLVRSLPFPNADQLVRVLPAHAPRTNLSLADFVSVRERLSSFASV